MASLLLLSITMLSSLGNKHYSRCGFKQVGTRQGEWEVVLAGMIRLWHRHRLRERAQLQAAGRVSGKDPLVNIVKALDLLVADIRTGDLSRSRRIISSNLDDCGKGWDVQGCASHKLMAYGGDDIHRQALTGAYDCVRGKKRGTYCYWDSDSIACPNFISVAVIS